MIARRVVPVFAVVTLLASALVLGSSQGSASAEPPAPKVTYFVRACSHDGYVNVSSYSCGDTTGTPLTMTFSPADIESQVLMVKLKNGKQLTQDLQPGTDAVIMSNVAIRKFLLPYYLEHGNLKKVAELRRFLGVIEHTGPGKTLSTMP